VFKGDGKLRGTEEQSASKLSIPLDLTRGTLNHTVLEDEFRHVISIGPSIRPHRSISLDGGLERPQQTLAVILHFTDRIAYIVERQVRRGLAKALGDSRGPTQGQLFERAHIEITIMEESLQ
jgi:hypothetical protein